MNGLQIEPATPDRWDDLVRLFCRPGPRGGRPVTDGCWCMWWRQRTQDAARNRDALAEIVADGREPGLLAYRDGEPVGWVSVGPREEFGQLYRSPTYRPTDDDEGVFSIVCFYVHSRDKRQGIATELLDAAVESALSRGASAVEAYPMEKPDYMGTVSMFLNAGFIPVREAGPRTVVRYQPDQA